MKHLILVALVCTFAASTMAFAEEEAKGGETQVLDEAARNSSDSAENSESSEPKKQMPGRQQEKSSREWRFALGLGYMLVANAGEFDEVQYDSGSTSISGTSELDYEQTFSLVLEGRILPQYSWGFLGGLNYEGERELEGGFLRGGGVNLTFVGGSNASKVQFTTLYGSAAYRWSQFYLPFGFNYSVVEFTPASGSTASSTEGGGLGAQLGVGFMVNQNLALEIYSWVTSMSLKSTSSTEVLDYGQGYFSSIVFKAKYVF